MVIENSKSDRKRGREGGREREKVEKKKK